MIPPDNKIQTVAIVGVGLIGGSFALALREAGFTGEIVGVSSQPAIQAGVRWVRSRAASHWKKPHLSRT